MTGNGYLENVPVTLKIINADATATPAVYGFSINQVDKENFDPQSMLVNTVLASKQTDFPGASFDYLVMNDANFSAADIIFEDGHAESQLTEGELKALLVLNEEVPASVQENNYIVVDNTEKRIRNMRLYAGAGGQIDVVTIQL